jgi:hypothetical protein
LLGEARLGPALAFASERETEIASELRIDIHEFGWPRHCGGHQQALARFQNKKKERAVILLRIAKLPGPQRRRNSRGGHRQANFRGDVCGVAP